MLRGFEIDHQFKFLGLLYGQIRRFGTFQNLVYVIGDAPVAVRDVRAVLHQPTVFNIFLSAVHRRQAVL